MIEAFRKRSQRQKLDDEVELKVTGCHGFCERGTLVVIHPQGILYQTVKPEDVPEILTSSVREKEIIDRLLYVDPVTREKITYEKDIPFYKKQKRVLLGMNPAIDPTDIEDYIAYGGYRRSRRPLAE